MLLIGLTGGIGSGKSSVSSRLAERGAVVIDADAIVHDLQRPGRPVLDAMVEAFGTGILRPDGTLDRAQVAELVFSDPSQLQRLNDIVHPAVRKEIFERIAAESSTDHIVILDVPLLAESGMSGMSGTVVVDVDPDVAVDRLVRYRGFEPSDARARVSRQASREQRLALADFVVDNSGTLDDLDARVELLWDWLTELQRSGASSDGLVTFEPRSEGSAVRVPGEPADDAR